MDFIPVFRFIVSIIMFGLLYYVYDPVISYLNNTWPTSGTWATLMFAIWGLLAAVNLFSSGIKMVMDYQKKIGDY